MYRSAAGWLLCISMAYLPTFTGVLPVFTTSIQSGTSPLSVISVVLFSVITSLRRMELLSIASYSFFFRRPLSCSR